MKNININTSQLEVKRQRLTKLETLQFTLSQDLKDILVGLMLGDLYCEKQKTSVNTRLRFTQGIIHEDYLLHLYELFSNYCPNAPKTSNPAPDKRTGKIYNTLIFTTFSLPCFNELKNLFYPAGKKVVPLNIADLLTPLGLAYWISDDGSWNKNSRRVTLSTNSFTIAEVNLLVSVLNKWNLKCHVNKHKPGYVIKISADSLPVLQDLLAPHMPSMMRYKIGL